MSPQLAEPLARSFLLVNLLVGVALWLCIDRAARALPMPRHMPERLGSITAAILLAVPLLLVGVFTLDDHAAQPLNRWLFAAALVGTIAALALVAFVGAGRLFDAIPQPALIGIQVYRAIGGLFLAIYAAGHLPGYFAFPAAIGDLATGLLAPLVALCAWRAWPGWRGLAIAWNLLGLLDLLLAIGIGSTLLVGPAQAAFGTSAVPLDTLLTWPTILIPGFAVPIGVVLHLASLRLLLRRPALATRRVSSFANAH